MRFVKSFTVAYTSHSEIEDIEFPGLAVTPYGNFQKGWDEGIRNQVEFPEGDQGKTILNSQWCFFLPWNLQSRYYILVKLLLMNFIFYRFWKQKWKFRQVILRYVLNYQLCFSSGIESWQINRLSSIQGAKGSTLAYYMPLRTSTLIFPKQNLLQITSRICVFFLFFNNILYEYSLV